MSTISNKQQKHTWSREETTLVTRAFLEGKSPQQAHDLVPDIKFISIKQKYTTCASLDRKKENGVTKMHLDVWNELKCALTVPEPDTESTMEDQGSGGYWSEDHEEDGETYNMCTGTCGRVCYYEDTDGEGMCGKCQFESQRKGSRRK
jgi:hypothetical protein